jgi:RsiW-degrading membrane proteinase PrsW (M82 family)
MNPWGGQGHGPPPHGGYPQHGYPPQQGGYPHHGYSPPPVAPRDPDRGRRVAGLTLWILGVLVGVALNLLFTMAEVLLSKDPGVTLEATMIGAVLAFPPLVVYLFVPAVIDRYDPEPWWCLAMAFIWGAFAATGFAGTVNTGVAIVASDAFGEQGGEVITAVISAPLSEEIFKGMAILGFFFFLRREFDGVVDGIIYATFCALGFAAVENVQYYARAAVEGTDILASTFFIRGVVAPWGHPLYTSMTGIGFGLARESSQAWVRALGPVLGLCAGMLLHATWNFVPTVFGGEVFAASLILWLLFVLTFFCIVIGLVARKGRVIRDHLRDEVALGTLTHEELMLVCSPVGRLRATFSWRGAAGRRLIRAAARLGLSKWHALRAARGQRRTISADFIVPLRQEILTVRSELARRAPRGR